MEKIKDNKHFQKIFSTKFLVELQGIFNEFFRTWNYLNYLSELLARVSLKGKTLRPFSVLDRQKKQKTTII